VVVVKAEELRTASAVAVQEVACIRQARSFMISLTVSTSS